MTAVTATHVIYDCTDISKIIFQRLTYQSVVSKTPGIAPYLHWKDEMPICLEVTLQESKPSQNAIMQLSREDSKCLLFKMVAGVLQVLQQPGPTLNMEHPQLVKMMARVDRGPIRSTRSKVIKFCTSWTNLFVYVYGLGAWFRVQFRRGKNVQKCYLKSACFF